MASPQEQQPIEALGLRNPEQLPHPEILQLTETAREAALASGKVVLATFGKSAAELQTEFKRDGTPKTIADEEGDRAIVGIIRTNRPHDNIVMEESGFHKALPLKGNEENPDALTWYADSLDGTRPFTEGKPESTVGVGVFDKDGNYLAAAIVHPFRRQLGIAARGMGAQLIELDEDLNVTENSQELKVAQGTSLKGATVCVDSLFNGKTRGPKHALMSAIEERAEAEGGLISYDMTGSNIAYELEVARGVSLFGITDAKGGDWDWNIGAAVISEAGGVMIDPTTGEKPNAQSEVMIYGNQGIVDQVLPMAAAAYQGYKGFK